jgi:hypothetical protein
MALLEDARRSSPALAPDASILAVERFLRRCLEWADEVELPKRRARVQTSTDAADAASLHAWLAYRAFTEHALQELGEGTLDHWFPPPTDDPPG